MFRGGPVDSRGTGITSGLGYEAGGRVGFDNGGSPFLRTPIGGQIVEAQKKKPFLNFNTLNDLNYTAGLSEAYKKTKPLNSEDKTSVVDVVDESQEKEVDSKGFTIDDNILDTDFDTTERAEKVLQEDRAYRIPNVQILNGSQPLLI